MKKKKKQNHDKKNKRNWTSTECEGSNCIFSIYTHTSHTRTHTEDASMLAWQANVDASQKRRWTQRLILNAKKWTRKKKTRRGDLPLDTIFNGIWRLLTRSGMRHGWRYGACDVRVPETHAMSWYKGQQANLENIADADRGNKGEQFVKWVDPSRRGGNVGTRGLQWARALHCWGNIPRCFSGEFLPKPDGEKKGAQIMYSLAHTLTSTNHGVQQK